MKQGLILLFALCLGACSSVTIRTDDAQKTKSTPDFQESYHYFWWGFKGENTVNVREVCGAKKVQQMQSVATIPDVFLGLITLGIYVPRTARVWCSHEQIEQVGGGINE